MSDTDFERLEESDIEVARSVSLASSSKVVCLDWDYCLCHTVESASSDPIIQFSHRSWEKLHEVSRVRGDDDLTYEFLSRNSSSSDDSLRGGYHRRCYQDCSNKTNVLRLLRRKQAESSAVKEAIPPSAQSRSDNTRHVRSAFPVTDYRFRIICQNNTSKQKRTKSRLVSCELDAGTNRLTKAAQLHKDERLLLALQGDIYANEVKYHRSCYVRFTKITR